MKAKFQRLKQPTPKELTDACLDFLRRKFYNQPGDDKCFFQDRNHLLRWVVLWPASWLNKKGVTIHGDAYREIFMKVFMQAAANVKSKVKYRPAYLAQVIQSHFAIHGEEYYNDAKSVRALVEQTMLLTAAARQAVADPVKDLAKLRDLVSGIAAKKTVGKPAVKEQLTFL